jgi:hypothetical protein
MKALLFFGIPEFAAMLFMVALYTNETLHKN